MTSDQLEAIKRAVSLRETVLANRHGAKHEIHKEDWAEIFTALTALKPVAEGDSVIVSADLSKWVVEAEKAFQLCRNMPISPIEVFNRAFHMAITAMVTAGENP